MFLLLFSYRRAALWIPMLVRPCVRVSVCQSHSMSKFWHFDILTFPIFEKKYKSQRFFNLSIFEIFDFNFDDLDFDKFQISIMRFPFLLLPLSALYGDFNLRKFSKNFFLKCFFSISILMILIFTNFTFHFTRFRFVLHLYALYRHGHLHANTAAAIYWCGGSRTYIRFAW